MENYGNLCRLRGRGLIAAACAAGLIASAARGAPVDIAVSKSVASPTGAVDGLVTFIVGVTNLSAEASAVLEVTDRLPTGLFAHAVAASQGAYDPVSGVWTVGAVSASGAATLQVQARVDPGVTVITNPAPANFERFGYAMAGLGTRLAVAEWLDLGTTQDVGAVHLLNYDATLVRTITNPTPAAYEYFGSGLSALSTNLLIGSPGDMVGGQDVGVVYLYSDAGQRAFAVTNPTPQSGDGFGESVVALGATRFAVSAPYDDVLSVNDGTIYLYRTNVLIAAITNPTGSAYADFGHALSAVSNDLLVVGAPFNAISGRVGAAYLYSTSGALRATLHNPGFEGEFGDAVAGVGSNRVLIGARLQEVGESKGQAYLFDTNGTLLARIGNPRPGTWDGFGRAVADAGSNRIFVAALRHAYLFDYAGGLLAAVTNPAFSEFELMRDQPVLQADGRMALGCEGVTNAFATEGAVLQFDLRGRLAGALTNRATLTVAGTDTNASNDQAAATIAFASVFADVSVAKKATPAGFDRSTPVVFTITASNAGAAAVSSFDVTDRLPPGLIITSAVPSQGAFDTTTLVWAAGALAPAGAATLQLSAVLDPAPREVGALAPALRDSFGYSMAPVYTGVFAVGSPQADDSVTNEGAVHLFRASGEYLGSLYNPVPSTNGWFGYPVVQVAEHFVAVGATENDTGATNAGSVYLYRDFALVASITNPLPNNSDGFGSRMAAVGGGRFAVGDMWQGGQAGVVHLYDLSGNRLVMLTNRVASSVGRFGAVLAAVSSNRFVVGAPNESSVFSSRGAAYLYDLNGTFVATLACPGATFSAEFGSYMTRLASNRFVVAAPRQTVDGQSLAGLLFLYDATAGAHLATITNPTPAAAEFFGSAAAPLPDGGFAVGVAFDNSGLSSNGAYRGLVYYYTAAGALRLAITNPFPDQVDSFGYALSPLPGGCLLVSALPNHAFCYDSDGSLRAGWSSPDASSAWSFPWAPTAVDDQTLAIADFASMQATGAVGSVWLYNLPLLAGGSATNEAVLTRMADPDLVQTNNSGRAAATPLRADLRATLVRTAPFVQPGLAATYEVTISNRGPGAASGVVVTSLLQGLQIATGAPAVGVFSPTASNWAWQAGSLGAGQAAGLAFTASVDSTITNYVVLTQQVWVTALQMDPVAHDNRSFVWEAPLDIYEVDDTTNEATAFAIGQPQVHHFHASNDVDWVAFYVASQVVNEAVTQATDYAISVEQLGGFSDVMLDLLQQLPDGTWNALYTDYNLQGTGVGVAETIQLTAPDDGWYLLAVKTAYQFYWGYDSEYVIDIDFTPSSTLILSAVDLLNPSQAPPGTVATINGGSAKSFNGATSVSYAGLNGVVTVRVTAAAGYFPEEDPKAANQTGNKFNLSYGNPRVYTAGNSAGLSFKFYPAGRATGEVRDAWTGERLSGARLAFRARAGLISNLVYKGFPPFSTYESPWLTADGGGFPSNVVLPTTGWDLSVTGAYGTAVFSNILPGLTRGTVSNLGVLFVQPIDTNGNGIADGWESRFFGAPTNLPPGGDLDGDHADNRSEYLAGTDPTNAASRLDAGTPAVATNGLRVTWPVVAGRAYRLRSSEDLAGPDWQAVGGTYTAAVGQSSMEVTDTQAVMRADGAYRVEVVLP